MRGTFVAGWPMSGGENPSWNGPASIKAALLLLIGKLYAHRGEMVPGNLTGDPAVSALLAPWRMFA